MQGHLFHPCAGPSLSVCIGRFPHRRSLFGSLPPYLAPSTSAFCGSLYSSCGPQALFSTQGDCSGLHRLVAFVQSSHQEPHPVKSIASSPAGCSPQPDLFLWQHSEELPVSVLIYCLSAVSMLTAHNKTLVCSLPRSSSLPYGPALQMLNA